jgi:hypothetical protein
MLIANCHIVHKVGEHACEIVLMTAKLFYPIARYEGGNRYEIFIVQIKGIAQPKNDYKILKQP